MQRSINRLARGFESSCTKTPGFLGFSRTFRNELKTVAAGAGFELASFNTGHFYLSGFLKNDSGKIVYFMTSDVRSDRRPIVYLRTAQSLKDYTGGANVQTNFDDIANKLRWFKAA